MKPEKFPLSWPQGYPVTEYREVSKFKCTFAEARDGVFSELSRLGVSDFFISCNVQRDKKGELVEGRLIYDNPGVAVYFTLDGEERVVACDKWKYIHENMRAVEKTIEAIRGMDRWGCSDIIARAVPKLAIEQQAGKSKGAWWQTLGVEQDAPLPYITSAYKRLAKKYHPDMPTANRDMFDMVQNAYDVAVATKGRE